MSSRVNHPLKSLFLFALVLGFFWASYEFLYVRRVFEVKAEAFLDRQDKDVARERVLDRLSREPCLVELGPLHYRAKEDTYRLDWRVADGCHGRAKEICEEISAIVTETVRRKTAVWAYDVSGNTVAKYVP